MQTAHGVAVGGAHEDTRKGLLQMGPQAVREALEAQRRYSRKRHREDAHEERIGETNTIRLLAALMGICLGYQVETVDGEMAWRHKARRTLIEEIVRAVEIAR